MNAKEVTVVRVYLHEGQQRVPDLLRILHDESRVRGVTVFRGITGFGASGRYHSSTLIDMSLDLPVVVEFFDDPEKIAGIIEELNRTIKPGHMVWWNAQVNMDGGGAENA